MRIVHGFVLLSFLGLGLGCGGSSSSSSDTAVSQDALDTTDVTSSEAALLTSAADVTTTSVAADGIAADLAAGWAAKFTPAGCAMSTSQGSTVTLVLDACTGPFGLVAATGTLALDIGISQAGYTGHATATALEINKATINVDDTFTLRSSGGTSTLTVVASGSATGPRGRALTRKGTYTVTWGAGCLTLDGNWTSTVDAVTYTTTLSSYSVCEGGCPASGGTVSWTGASRALSISYDGTAEAQYSESGPKGNTSGSVALLCTASS